ncbi:MAG: ABC transporter permease, partial [Terriglobales bacterium]
MGTATTTAPERRPPRMVYGEVLSFAYETFRSNKVRFALTALGMVIGTASLILVVTIGMTGKQYVLNQIQSIGTNQIEAEYQSGGQRVANVTPDPLTIDDMKAALEQVPGIVAASPVVSLGERIPVGGGKERDISVLGVFPDYKIVRNLVVVTGRFFDSKDEQEHTKVGVITQKMAEELYGSQPEAIGKTIKLTGLPFTIVGTFRERVDTFGQTEVVDYTMLIPYTVSRYFTDTPTVKQIYFSVSDSDMVIPATAQIKRVIQARHRPESVYNVDNLTQLVAVAEKTANALTMVLL